MRRQAAAVHEWCEQQGHSTGALALSLAAILGAALPQSTPAAVTALAVAAVAVARRRNRCRVMMLCFASVWVGVAAHASTIAHVPRATVVDGRTAVLQESTWRGIDGRLGASADLDGARVFLRFDDDPTGVIRTLGYGASVEIEHGVVTGARRPTVRVRDVGSIRAPQRLVWATAMLRDAMGEALQPVPPSLEPLARGLILGDDRELPADRAQVFRDAGMSHLTAVSGQNVAYAMAIVGSLHAARSSRRRAIGVTVAAIVFGFVVGWQASVRRAVASACITVFAMRRGRAPSTLTTLALSAAGCIAIDPVVVHDLGFRLSCVAVAGLSILGTPIGRLLPRWRGVGPAIGACIGAQVATAPIIWSLDGQVSLSSIPANVIAVPVAGFVMAWGLAAGPLAALVGAPLPTLYCWPVSAGTAVVDSVATIAAAYPVLRLTPRTLGAALIALAVVVVPTWRSRWANVPARVRETP